VDDPRAVGEADEEVRGAFAEGRQGLGRTALAAWFRDDADRLRIGSGDGDLESAAAHGYDGVVDPGEA
jgi:hypothetical protein